MLTAALAVSATLAACQGCKNTESKSPAADAKPSQPTLRLYVLSSVAGALEPCGCSKDQLGGVDHLAAYMQAEASRAPASLVVGAGPLFFSNYEVEESKQQQNEWKAEAMAEAASKISLAAWAPSANDWAAGNDALASYAEKSGASMLAANLDGASELTSSVLKEAGGLKVGIVGVSDPKGPGAPEGIDVDEAGAAVKKELASLKESGAQVLVVLAALPRGDALRIVDNNPELNLLVIGKPRQRGEANDKQRPVEMIGKTLIVEAANNLQTIGVVDLFVVGEPSGPVDFADATGVAKAEELVSLSERIRELEARINNWEGDPNVDQRDLQARRGDLAELKKERETLAAKETEVEGSYFRFSTVEVREGLGADAAMSDVLLAHYKRVNEHNKEAFKDRTPPPAPEGTASYIGIEECTLCHEEEREVWDKTGHAKAYETLEKGFKEFNLDCVGCHVTGYDRPGGSTVTHVADFKDVQCEVCHGPGSLHADNPEEPGLIELKPDPQACVDACHHPPHVEGFDPVAKMKLILGPGHGM